MLANGLTNPDVVGPISRLRQTSCGGRSMCFDSGGELEVVVLLPVLRRLASCSWLARRGGSLRAWRAAHIVSAHSLPYLFPCSLWAHLRRSAGLEGFLHT